MSLQLENISIKVGRETHIHPTDLGLQAGTLNVLLGPTLSGKTSLMRLMAGLDKPTAGRVLWNGGDVTGLPVQRRNVAMVYQQFINYPSMTVYENIASPLRLQGLDKGSIDRKVREIAELMKLDPLLEAPAPRTVRRTAAALCAGPCAGQGRRSGVAGRAVGESGLQAARGTARRRSRDSSASPGRSSFMRPPSHPRHCFSVVIRLHSGKAG